MKKKSGFLLQTQKEIRCGAAVAGVGFLLYMGTMVLKWRTAADILAIGFGLVALYVFFSALNGRDRDKEMVSYNLLWGTGALALLLLGCAVASVRQRLGL